MDYQHIIDIYYPPLPASSGCQCDTLPPATAGASSPVSPSLRLLLLKHSHQVADRCLRIAQTHPELNLDESFLEEAAMLHDIGIRWCHAPGIFCQGTEPYIRHGLIGGQLLRQLGLERHARVCERHTGTGITLAQISRQGLPLPPDGQYCPQTLEEQVVCYADKFYSKSRPDRVLTVEETAESLRKFGEEGVEKFLHWAEMFE